jgi:hypothetical protein
MRARASIQIGLFLLTTLLYAISAHAQGRTDVVTLSNQDRITGEVVKLERGRLEFKTDDAGTLYLEWEKLAGVVAARLVEVVTVDGRRFLGTLGPAPDRSIAVVAPGGTTVLTMLEVANVGTIGSSFWSKLDGSIDVGFNYTRSSGVAQLNGNFDVMYTQPAARSRLTASLTQTQKDDGSSRDDRASIDMSYLKYPWRRWFFTAMGRLERNESLGLELRSQGGAAAGPRLVNTNRAQVVTGAGVVVNDERGVGVESTRNVEALLLFSMSYFTYDRPKTNIDIDFQYYPSLSDPGRQRVQLDAALKYELLKDFFVSFTLYDSFDSRPPNPDADRNDIGIITSLGWSF